MQMLSKRVVGGAISHPRNHLAAPSYTATNNTTLVAEVHTTGQNLVRNKAIDPKERLSRPNTQLRGMELLRNPSLYKV